MFTHFHVWVAKRLRNLVYLEGGLKVVGLHLKFGLVVDVCGFVDFSANGTPHNATINTTT